MSLLLAVFKQFLCKVIGYYDQGTIFRFLYTPTGIQLVPNGANSTIPKILIVSRAHYQEKVNKYPIEDRKAVAKILNMELNPHNERYIITSVESAHSYVNIWSFKKDIPKSTIVIPETFLLQQQLSNNQVIVKTSNQGKLFVAAFNRAVSSLFASDFIHSVERFGLSIGQTLGTTISINPQQLPNVLVDSIVKASKLQLLNFTNRHNNGAASAITIKSLVLPTMAIVSCYFLATSLWLVWQNKELEHDFSEQKLQMESALKVQNDFIATENELIILDDFLAKQNAKSSIWLVLYAIANHSTISACRFNEGRFVIIGETSKATNLLEMISLLPGIRDAKFDVPIRITQKAENFNISFVITKHVGQVGGIDVEIN